MRCPKCRAEIPFEALKHSACGWRVSGLEPGPSSEIEIEERAQRAVIDANLQRMRAVVKHRASAAVENDRVKRKVAMLSDVGHGSVCTCEVCWRLRMPLPLEYPNEEVR